MGHEPREQKEEILKHRQQGLISIPVPDTLGKGEKTCSVHMTRVCHGAVLQEPTPKLSESEAPITRVDKTRRNDVPSRRPTWKYLNIVRGSGPGWSLTATRQAFV